MKQQGNGNYLGQTFEGVQPCPRCKGYGFLCADGTTVNPLEDSEPFIPCPDCSIMEVSER